MNRTLRTFAFAVALTIMLSMFGVVVVYGQGGTGRVTPTPTPTPKKTTPKKPTPAKTTSDSKTSQPAKSTTSDSNAAEMIFWNSIKDSRNPEDFRSYLQKYPKGEFADLARNRISSLEDKASWEKIKDSSNPEDFKEYLKKYPASEFIGLAANRLKTLETAKSATNPSSSNMPRRHTNGAAIEFVLIPPGSFMMGSTNGKADEKPVHQVTISQAFYISKYEVTQTQWQSVMGSNPSSFKDCGRNCPVEQVSWNDAQDFINKLNEANDGFKYRLPSEAEWEYSCRGGTIGDFYAADVDDIGWYEDNSGKKTHAAGSKQPNAFGLYDMSGNVWEWCRDRYHENYNGAPTDGSAWLSVGWYNYRVLRGGSWVNDATFLRSAPRNYGPPDARANAFGFRVVAVAGTQ
jgi:formylglycine-generating enzyme required for sulfatase activity